MGVAVVDHVTEEVTHEHAHNCMCVPDGRTRQARRRRRVRVLFLLREELRADEGHR